jgi:hypothetical protein
VSELAESRSFVEHRLQPAARHGAPVPGAALMPNGMRGAGGDTGGAWLGSAELYDPAA